ncbi:uncharacterized protein LOC134694771 [Mytilus trossulus]|uniref:uncharacterized protein LOC134694771 n=1 Tax=Mytilus trossulus TaxID=6551 RepID=UPI00300662D9
MTSISQLTEEEKNFTRFFLLNFKVSPDIARRYFNVKFPPAHLALTLNNSMNAIMKLNKSRRINTAQLEILRGVPGTIWPSYLPPMTAGVGSTATSSKDFDLTMMICLLRNIGGLSTPSNGWDKLPHPNDTSPGAALAILKWYRNQLAHTTVTSFDNNEFKDKLTMVETALNILNNGQRPKEVTEILNYDLDGDQAKLLAKEDLEQLKKVYLDRGKEKEQIQSDFSHYKKGNLPNLIAEANATLVESWIKDDKYFYETKGSELVYDQMDDCSCILLTSNLGFGKTATIRHIAIQYKLNGFEIISVESPEDIIKYKTNEKQVFLIDDVLGKYDLDLTLLDNWERINEKLISSIETGQGSTKILCTLRLNISLHQRFKNATTILNKVVVNLEQETTSLSKEEKQNILRKQLMRSNLETEIETEEVDLMCETNYAFPLLCKLVVNNEERFRKRKTFFRQPLSLLDEELDKMSNKNKNLYCILLLCMMFNGSFSRNMFDIDSDECDKKIYKMTQTCGLQRNISKIELENGALSALRSYFRKENNNFEQIHNVIEQTVGWQFCTMNPKGIFEKALENAEQKHRQHVYQDSEKEKDQIDHVCSIASNGNLPKNITDSNATFVETWIKDDETCYETQGSELVYEKIKDCSCVVVTSTSGLGKTAIIRHIALKFKHEGFEIIIVETPDDILKYKTTDKHVFLIDDVLGKYNLSPTILDTWEKNNENLITYFENTGTGSKKIMCSMRLQIALHTRFKKASTILNKGVINLECEPYAPSEDEKQNILLKHLQSRKLEGKIEQEEVNVMCETNYAFPLICKLVSSNEDRFRKRIAFFRQPLSLLKEELNKMSNENKQMYCVLVLCMLFNGSFSRDMFDIDSSECDKKINKIMQTCGLPRNMSKRELGDSALSVLGSYFTMDSNSFRFIHDALEETVSWHFCTLNPKEMFSDCNILFIRDRVRIYSGENINESFGENIVIIQEDELNEDHIRSLYNRLWTEINNGRFSNLLMSQFLKNKNFVHAFGTHLEKKKSTLGSKKIFSKVSSERRNSFHPSIFQEFFKTVSIDEFRDKKDAISRVLVAKVNRSTLMDWIVAFGCYELFQFAWSSMTSSEQKCILGRGYMSKSFLPLAVLGGSFGIVKELIRTGADVNCFSEFWETPLFIAVKLGRCDIASLLLRNGARLNLRGWFDMKIPILVTSNNYQLTLLILKYDLNQTKLHKAVRHNDLHILRSNISSDIIDHKTKSGWTVLHYAVLLNNLEAVKILFHDELTQKDESYLDCLQVDQREYVWRKPTPTVSIADNNGLTTVHLAVINNNTEILSLLLQHKADVKFRDVLGRTPLHYTTSESAKTLLLTYSAQN